MMVAVPSSPYVVTETMACTGHRTNNNTDVASGGMSTVCVNVADTRTVDVSASTFTRAAGINVIRSALSASCTIRNRRLTWVKHTGSQGGGVTTVCAQCRSVPPQHGTD